MLLRRVWGSAASTVSAISGERLGGHGMVGSWGFCGPWRSAASGRGGRRSFWFFSVSVVSFQASRGVWFFLVLSCFLTCVVVCSVMLSFIFLDVRWFLYG